VPLPRRDENRLNAEQSCNLGSYLLILSSHRFL